MLSGLCSKFGRHMCGDMSNWYVWTSSKSFNSDAMSDKFYCRYLNVKLKDAPMVTVLVRLARASLVFSCTLAKNIAFLNVAQDV